MKKTETIDIDKINADNLKEFLSSGRCNSCRYFNFGKRCCTKTEDGKLVRPDKLALTYTDKSGFISFVKPNDCNDFTPKSAKKEIAKEET